MKKLNIPKIEIIDKVQEFAIKHPRTTLIILFFIIGLLIGVIIGRT